MLITVSGMVGSGKTTAVREIVSFAKANGLDAQAHRFQSLPCISFRPQRARSAPRPYSPPRPREETAQSPRWTGYRRKRLGAASVAVFAARVLAFRVYRRAVWKGAGWNVLNRYFYDSLSHYQPRSGLERLYYRAILALIPTPDLAILVTARPDTIAVRRPAYAREYVELVGESYRYLASEIHHLVEISTDDDGAENRLAAVLRANLR